MSELTWMLPMVGEALGLTSKDLDALFTEAAGLSA